MVDADLGRAPERSTVSGRFPGGVRTTAEIARTLTRRRDRTKNHTIPLVASVQFPSRPVPIPPYLLGVLLGDGNLREHGVRLSTADREIVESARRLLPAALRLTHEGSYDYRITTGQRGRQQTNPLLEALRELHLGGKRSEEKFVPTAYLFNDVPTRLALLRGLMDYSLSFRV